MILFKRDGTRVKVEVDSKLAIPKSIYLFYWEASGEGHAELLVNQLQTKFSDALREARREAYNAGFKDAKAKRKREDWFWGGLE